MDKVIKAVIFDMDGVLIDAKEWHYEALNKALNIFGYSISRHDHLVSYDGLPTKQKLEMLSKERGLPKKLHFFINEVKQKYTLELVYSNCKPIFQHEYALAKLKSNGYKIGCASNSIRNSIDIMLKKSNLYKYMDTILSAEDVENPKPDPEIYIKSIESLRLKPNNILIIEDNEHGILAAKASGAHVMVVKSIDEVNIQNIEKKINEISKKK
jgi:beta-phosphoglucomutase